MVGIAMVPPSLDDYVVDVLMRDLVGHDRKPVSFLVYLWLAVETRRRNAAVRVSYQQLAETIGASKRSVQAGVKWLIRRRLLAGSKETPTSVPRYTVLQPWRDAARHRSS
jgi:hypothetical protein